MCGHVGLNRARPDETPDGRLAAAAASDPQRSWSCAIDGRGTPVCRWCLSRINLDVTLVWDEHLTKLPPDVPPMGSTPPPRGTRTARLQACGCAAVVLMWPCGRFPQVRSIVLPEYIEELTAEALGAGAALPFWRDCFGPRAPPFFLTAKGTAEHEHLWQTR